MKSFGQKGVAPILLLVAVIGVIAFLAVANSAPFKNNLLSSLFPKEQSHAAGFVAPTPIPGCALGNTTPVGQANPSMEYEPMGAIWCYPLATLPPGFVTRVTGTNDWVDEFNINQQMIKFSDGVLDYRVFDNIQNGGQASHTQHYLNANHWMDDNAGGFLGGAMLRPNRTFKFENGKMVIEADVAASIPCYATDCTTAVQSGDVAWPEIDISMGDHPTGNSKIENLYGYGQFQGNWTIGCRLHNGPSSPICSVEAPTALSGSQYPLNDTPPCNSFTPSRLMEISWFEQCGSTHNGGWRSGTYAQYSRQCGQNDLDMVCRDRFRMEITKTSITVYINGFKYFEDANWAAKYQLPDTAINGDWFVYFTDWEDSPNKPLYRFHWDRVAVNPHDVPGHLQPPTQAPSFCLGKPGNTCPMVTTSEPGLPAVSRNTVDLLDFVNSPPDITVTPGTTVTWTNASTQGIAHSVTSDTGAFDSGIFNPGQKYSFTFNTPGVYHYHCLPHPNMIGTVTVLSGSSPMPSMTPAPSSSPTPMPSMSMPPSPSPSPSVNPSPTASPTIVATYNANLTGSQETPANNSTATGNSTLTLYSDNTAKVNLSFSGLSSAQVSAHIHGPAPVGTAAGILFTMPMGNFTGQMITLTPTQVTQLQTGQLYINVHSTNFGNGEIRGQFGTGSPSSTPQASAKPGDIDGNNKVDIFDYNILLTNFGKTGTNIQGDFDHNNKVDIFDYNILLSNFGK